MTDLQNEAIEIIEKELIFGFMEEDELLEEILETFVGEDISVEWIGEQVVKMYRERQDEIDEWDPEEANDFDRIANAFDELAERNVIALHRPGYTTEDGIEEVTEAFKTLMENGVRPIGYVFYHTGHLETAISDKARLDLVFGAMTKAPSQVRGVANLIVETLQRYDLDATWGGNPGDAIKINDIDWMKEPDDEDWGVERCVSIMSGDEMVQEEQEEEEDEE
ncbi:MAG: hypothetical protein AB8F78_03790 [Saprospiraceae bacterium]